MNTNLVCSFHLGNYHYSYKENMPETVEHKEGSLPVLNLALSIAEIAVLGYICNTIAKSTLVPKDQSACLFYVEMSEGFQTDFNGWLQEHIFQKQSLTKHSHVIDLLNSIWIKTQVFIDSQLQYYATAEEAKLQQELYKKATAKDMQPSSINKGRTFTLAQADLLNQITNHSFQSSHDN